MSIFAIAICAGIAAGFMLGGALRNAASVPVPGRFLLLVWAGLLLQVLAGFIPKDLGALDLRYASTLLSYGMILVFVSAWALLLGRRRPGPGLQLSVFAIGLGLLLNALVIALNHGMPVSAHALRIVGRNTSTDVTEGAFFKHVPLDGNTALPWLGDVIPTFPHGPVVSLGDVLLAIGISVLIASAMRTRSPRQIDVHHAPDPLTR